MVTFMDQTRNMIITQINKGLIIKNIESKENKKCTTIKRKRKNGRSNIVDKDRINSFFSNLSKNNSLFKLMMRIFLLYQILSTLSLLNKIR